jgi:hypothetical protein
MRVERRLPTPREWAAITSRRPIVHRVLRRRSSGRPDKSQHHDLQQPHPFLASEPNNCSVQGEAMEGDEA